MTEMQLTALGKSYEVSCLGLDDEVCLTSRHDGHLGGHNTLHSQVGQSSSHQTTGEGQILQRDKQSLVSYEELGCDTSAAKYNLLDVGTLIC